MIGPDSSSLKFWELVSEIGFVAVIIGVIGEGAELLVKWGMIRQFRQRLCKHFRRLLVRLVKIVRQRLLAVESVFFSLLVVGLATEFLGSHVATRIATQESARLNKEAAELRKQAEPRADRLRQSGFKNLVKGKASGEVEVVYAPYNGEAAGFAVELYNELSQSGWKMMEFKPKPADLEPTWASPRPLVPESFASIAIVSHDPIDEQRPRWQMVPPDAKPARPNEDKAVIHWDFSGSEPRVERVDRYQHRLPPAGVDAGVLAEALEKSGFHSERNVNSNLPPDEILVVIGAKE